MNQPQRHIIIGTSGHIDHGKSAIVRALTGTDPDRLQEEKDRGMTIDLGYAFYNDLVAFVDVPGHERFIKNMVAGVTSIDFVLLVVAADDGVMPQTREHLDILNLLGVQRGIIVINKIDLVEPDWLELIKEDVRELAKGTFLKEAPLVTFSAINEEGMEELRRQIDLMVEEPTKRENRGYFWMPVDRSFTIRGFGTVTTGSVNSGELHAGDDVELLPANKGYKVRGLQRHGHESDCISIGDRGAINLQGVHKDMIKRGDVLCTPDCGQATTRIDVRLQLLPASPWKLKEQSRVRLHIGTSEILARVRHIDREELLPGEAGLVQLILERPIAANRRDRFVIRNYSPGITIGGGIVLDNRPLQRHKRLDKSVLHHFEKMESPDLGAVILDCLQNSYGAKPAGDLVRSIGIAESLLQNHLADLERQELVSRIKSGDQFLFAAKSEVDRTRKMILGDLEEFHKDNPHLSGIGRAELSSKFMKTTEAVTIDTILEDLSREGKLKLKGDLIALASFNAGLTSEQQNIYDRILSMLRAEPYSPPTLKELYSTLNLEKAKVDLLINYGKSQNEWIVLQNGLIYPRTTLKEIQEMVRNWIEKKGSITAADLRDLIRASRKFAISILEYFDQIGFTVREGDERFLNS